MEIFEYFHINKHLFKCETHEFDDAIKNVMEKLIISDINNKIYFTPDMRHHNKHTKCAICLQDVGITNLLVICHNCCNICINKNVMINFGFVLSEGECLLGGLNLSLSIQKASVFWPLPAKAGMEGLMLHVKS